MKKKSYSNRFPQTEYKLTYLKKKSYVCNAKMLPALPEPYKGQYISISRLLASGVIPKDKMVELCRENGIELVLDTP